MLQAIVIGLGGILGLFLVIGAAFFVWDFFCFEEKKEEKLD
jgi:uncharacterized protein involved in exopolysaccharide biosynthesis